MTDYRRFSLLFLLQLLIAPVLLAGPKYSIGRIHRDESGRVYVVIDVRSGAPKEQWASFIVRFQKDGQRDMEFSDRGVLSFKNWEGWSEVQVTDLKTTAQGKLFVLGELRSQAPKMAFPPRVQGRKQELEQLDKELEALNEALRSESKLPAQPYELIEKLQRDRTNLRLEIAHLVLSAGNRFENGKAATSKAFISCFDAAGKPVEKYGENGTAILHGVLEHTDDMTHTLAIGEEGQAALAATVFRHDGSTGQYLWLTVDPKGNPQQISEARLSRAEGNDKGLVVPRVSLKDQTPLLFGEYADYTRSRLGVAQADNQSGRMKSRISIGSLETRPQSIEIKMSLTAAISPDHKKLYVLTTDQKRRARLRVVDMETSEKSRLTPPELNLAIGNLGILEFDTLPNGNLLFTGRDKQNPEDVALVEFDVAQNQIIRRQSISQVFNSQGNVDNCALTLRLVTLP